MMISNGIGLSPCPRRARAGSPALSLTARVNALFAGGVPGGMWDFTDPSTLRQMSNGTGAVADGDPVGWAQDLSDNGNHLVQAVALKRPGFGWEGAGFDGVDDSFNSIDLFDLSATGELVVCVALDRPSPSAGRIIAEITSNSSVNAGTIALFNGGNASIGVDRFRSRGTANPAPVGFAEPGPNRAIISCVGRISPSMRVMRRNGVEGVNSTSPQGTGTYGSWPLYIGSRGGVSEFFSGSIARLVICGRLPSPEETALIEAWCDEPLRVLP